MADILQCGDEMTLYQHQKDAIGFIFARSGNGALFMDCGTGKTLVALKAFEEMRKTEPALKLIAVMPLSILEAAWGEDIKKFTGFTYYNAHDKKLPKELKEDILLINYEAVILARNSGILNLMRGNMVVCDECFDGDTLIDTPLGKRKIKDIKKGDYIINCFGKCKVISRRMKKLDRRIKITYNNNTIICSLNHPFLTNQGWKAAKDIKKGEYLVRTNYAMSMVQERITGENIQQKRKSYDYQQESFLQSILFSEVENETTGNSEKTIHKRNIAENFKKFKQIYDVSPQRRKIAPSKTSKQDAFTRSKEESIRKIKVNALEANYTRWQRKTFADSPKQTCQTFRKDVGNRICCTHQTEISLSNKLQNRYCLSPVKDRNRGRWVLSLHQKGIRQKKSYFPKFFRVEDIKIYKQRGDGKRSNRIKKNIFYDLQIEKHPSFSVNGALVHNSSRLKGNTTRTAKFFLATRDLPKYKLIMTATPCPNNNPLEYYAQMEFIKPGVLHPSFYGFRNNYFHLQRGRQIMNGKLVTRAALFDAMRTGFKYEIAPQNLKKLMTRIEPHIFYARKKDCLDLPDQVDEVRKVALSPTQMRHYHEMKRDLITEIKGEMIVAQVALTKILKLQEIVSGFCFNSLGKISEIEGGDSKYKELLQVIEEIGDKQIIIWCRFRYEIQRLLKLLPGSCSLYSETKDKEDSINGFKNGKYKYLIANTHSAGHGLTFTNCCYSVYFSLDFSYEGLFQSQNRIHRIGQNNKCTYIYLIGKDTIEEDIYKVLKDKETGNKLIEYFLNEKEKKN